MLISLPVTSILALTWLYRDTGDADEVAKLAWSILWVIIPSLVFFVALPVALKHGATFWPALGIACAATAAAYGIWVLVGRRAGLEL